MENLKTKSIGEFVVEDYRTAAIFQKYGIDFCCKGGRTINEVCETQKISSDELLSNLNSVSNQSNGQHTDYQLWDLDLLADYIEKKHHRYVEQKTPALIQYLDKLCEVHGANHPELFEINEHFKAGAGVLAQHMKKEELVLFPFIRKMAKAKNQGAKVEAPYFGSIENPIKMMMDEHTIEGDRYREIETLSKNYTPPEDACNTYKVTFSLLKEFQEDLHIHIHLENNILFPKSIKLEKELI